ncbi:hypothetical protein ACFO5K_04275 [Nocardia halotolerans]|uniref:Uncharacterized protein n=1 Tax=Nocardia halotolerans TaxID=1755878 RepID=A0ABV8VF20_9NOCA
MKHIWLVSKAATRDGDSDLPVLAISTKKAAQEWVKFVAPQAVFHRDPGDGGFIACITRGSDPVCLYTIAKIPFGTTAADD